MHQSSITKICLKITYTKISFKFPRGQWVKLREHLHDPQASQFWSFGYWLGTCSSPSQYPNQYWHIINMNPMKCISECKSNFIRFHIMHVFEKILDGQRIWKHIMYLTTIYRQPCFIMQRTMRFIIWHRWFHRFQFDIACSLVWVMGNLMLGKYPLNRCSLGCYIFVRP